MGLKATAEDGQTLPGLICPLCGRHTVKSYSVWKKEKAPQKIKHLFKDGVTVIRACRKCVPYPPNRDRRLNDKVSNGRLTSSQSQGVKSQQKTNGKRGYECLENSKNETKDRLSKIEIQASKVKKNDLVFVNVGVKVARVNGNNARIERLKNGKNSKTLEDSDEDIVKKKARIEEKKRKIEIASGGELTGLECFESLPAEERINDHENWKIEEMKRSEDWLSCSEKDAKNNISSKEKDFKGEIYCLYYMLLCCILPCLFASFFHFCCTCLFRLSSTRAFLKFVQQFFAILAGFVQLLGHFRKFRLQVIRSCPTRLFSFCGSQLVEALEYRVSNFTPAKELSWQLHYSLCDSC